MRSRRSSRSGALWVAALLVAACAAPITAGPSDGPSGPDPEATGRVVVGPASQLPDIDPAIDPERSIADLEAGTLAAFRAEADFAGLAGAGWTALADSADAALDAAIRSLADEFGVDPPTSARDRSIASVVVGPEIPTERPAVSAAAAMALVMAASVAGEALGSGTSSNASSSTSRTSTAGDEAATTSVNMTGRVDSSGSRVTADFTFELSGQVVNAVTGATARLDGRATVRVEIDGCPDANGSSKGKLVLTSGETVTGGSSGGSASWTRDLQGTFDISVGDDAAISALVLDVDAQEVVNGGFQDSPEGHELGAQGHWEYTSGQGFNGLAPRDGASDGSVTHERNATAADLVKLFKSAALSISAAAILLGSKAEDFWRGGKCVEVLVDPPGGDVDPDSVTNVTATVRHRFENVELDKPVEATLVGVKAIDPAGEKQPAPAVVTFTAGSAPGDTGEITFKTVSNRGIGEKAVKFTVRPGIWAVTSTGTSIETFGPVSNRFTVEITALRIVAGDGGTLTGTGTMRLSGTVTSGPCTGQLTQVVTMTVSGTLTGTGPDQKLAITIFSPAPQGETYPMTCPGAPPIQMGSEGHSERYGEALGSFELPAAGGTVTITRDQAIGGIMQVKASATFMVAPVSS